MSIDVMRPTSPRAGEPLVLMVTGLSGQPHDKGISVEIEGTPVKADVLFESSRNKLTISVETSRSDRNVRFAVSDPNGTGLAVGRIRLVP